MENFSEVMAEFKETVSYLPEKTAEKIHQQVFRLLRALDRQRTLVEDEDAEVISDANLFMSYLHFDRDALRRENTELERRLDG